MNKFTKASIATGAGIVLLLGGAGTFAYWNDSAAVSGSSISSGTLSLGGTTTGTWKLVKGAQIDAASGGAESDDMTITTSTFRMVPGDKLVYVVDGLTVNATGDNLKATLGVSIPAADNGFTSEVSVSTHLSGSATGFSEVGGIIQVTPGSASVTTTGVYVVVDFPFGTSENNDNKSKTLTLSNTKLELKQVSSF